MKPQHEPKVYDGPGIICAQCGADATVEPCDLSCPNNYDTATRDEKAAA